MRVGNQDILLPVTMVGNYPEPRWFRGIGKYPGNPSRFIFDSMEQEALYDCISCIVDDQERAGFDIIADGRVFGGSDSYGQLLYHYMERTSGFVMNGPQIPVPIYSSLYAPTCIGEIHRVYPYHVETLKAVRRATNKPIKISYTGVGAMTAATNNQHYKDIKELAAAYAKALNEDMKELADIGVDIIQMDEFVWPYGMGDWEVDSINAAMEGVDCQFWVHTCWGNYSGTPGYAPDGKEKDVWKASVLDSRAPDAINQGQRAAAIFPKTNDTNIDVLNYEVGRTGPDDLKPLIDNNWDRPFVAGVIDVKSTITESADEVADRIRAVLEYVPADKLGVGTDCGLINHNRMVASSKLHALVAGAEIVRAELRAAQ
jgi:5-methyltetrahydropteroyltriglutamate--homocysteine methyltransferase